MTNIDNLEKKINDFENSKPIKKENKTFVLLVNIFASIFTGGMLGYGIDYLADSFYIATSILSILGFFAGINNYKKEKR